ncbi:MAG: hypothetical protein ILP17_13515 [Lachnospiraceae bacterium]|nr:hypothetical protein [Lachnospiraceae bacterium]
MESVYFGRESSPEINKDEKTSQDTTPVKEYYFPNEGHRKYKITAFFSVLFLTAIMDAIVLAVLIPLMIYGLEFQTPLFEFIDTESYIIIVGELMVFHVFFSLFLYLLIHNIGRRKVYVRDNDKFYFVKQVVRVNTNKAYFFESDTHLNKRVNAGYSRIIKKTDRLIAKGSGRIKKVLTGCKVSDTLHENGLFYTGYNEKSSCDEEFSIPSSYVKYDPASDHRTSNKAIPFIFLIKIILYICVFSYLIENASSRYSIYLNNIDTYVAKKEAVLAPLGFYQDTYGSEYDHLDYFIADDYFRSSRIRYGFTFSDDSKLVDEFVFIDLSLYKDDDIQFIKKIIDETYEAETLDLSVIDRTLQAYIDGGEKKATETVITERSYFTVTIESTELLGYDHTISIYIRDRERLLPNYRSWVESIPVSL